jgi:hypothetical protein
MMGQQSPQPRGSRDVRLSHRNGHLMACVDAEAWPGGGLHHDQAWAAPLQ